jgi:hypothetical protein
LTDSEERRKYRSWREGNAEFPHSSDISHHSRDRLHVDKKIEATIPKSDQPAAPRSRKSSHLLRVFKENEAAEEKKRREGRDKERRPSVKPMHTLSEEQSGGTGGMERSYSVSRPSSTVQSPHKAPGESYFETEQTVVDDAEEKIEASKMEGSESALHTTLKKHIPLRLLEEIRSFGNLTPGADRGTSSLPTSAAEKFEKTRATSEAPGITDYFQGRGDRQRESSPGSEEDESEKEQIASALYYPHRQIQSPVQTPGKEERRKAESEGIQKGKLIGTGRVPTGWSTDEAVKTPEEVEISLQSQDTNQCLHGDMPPAAPFPQEAEKPSSPELTTSVGSDYDSLVESSHSVAGDESSATDDIGTTPTATPRRKESKPPTPQPPAPLGAVELKPYDHQVGGHSTVYRFSRRAVCKQLNNRENEFYETVERHHPDLLEFLPRYEIFFLLTFGGFEAETSAKKTLPAPHLHLVSRTYTNGTLSF